jgi:Uma2 family endonuclease
MSTVGALGEQRVVIESVRWSTFIALLEDAGTCRGRMTYDQGRLEIMSPSKSHEQIGCLIGRMIEVFTEERQIEIVSVASLTVKSEPMKRAFEADEAYYIQRAVRVRGLDELDFTVDPAPDLVIEVDLSRSSIGKFPVFAAFQVPEVWLYRGDTLTLHCLHGDHYVETLQSAVLPGFPVAQIPLLVAQRTTVGETQLIRTFRESVQATS